MATKNFLLPDFKKDGKPLTIGLVAGMVAMFALGVLPFTRGVVKDAGEWVQKTIPGLGGDK